MDEHNTHYKAYSELRNEIDKITENLSARYKTQMQCRKGCDMCCMDYSILPVEFHYIREQLQKEGFKNGSAGSKQNANSCIFLKNSTCSIYSNRPVICRTHGLPLLYTNDDYEWELSTCELNFIQYDYDSFNSSNTYPQDKFNSMLFMLNSAFIDEYKEMKYDKFERIPLKHLAENL